MLENEVVIIPPRIIFKKIPGRFAHKNAFEAEYFDAEDEDKKRN